MHSPPVRSVIAFVALASWSLAGCAEGHGTQPAAAQSAAPASPTGGAVVARVGERTITLAEVDAKALQADATDFRGMRLGQALYEARRQVLDDLVSDAILDGEAKKRGVSRESLVMREVMSKVKPVEEADLQAWYKDNGARVGGQPFESVREPLKTLLTEQRKQEALGGYVASLRRDVPVTVSLDPPRVDVQIAANDPFTGPAGAPIQIVEFSDFQ
ncbi:MAG: hypothetical protein U0Q12_19665 [Vicinamibacterales bacterium]